MILNQLFAYNTFLVSNVITIDGPTSSGKSSVGHMFSQKIGYQFIDTGAIYRIGCLEALRKNTDLKNEDELVKIFDNLNVYFKSLNGASAVFLNNEEVTNLLHSSEITKIVPIVAAFPKVRSSAKKIQHKLGSIRDTVMAGRDIGSEIFPDSNLKFFITASDEIRAKRRFDQLVQKDPSVKYEDVLKSMQERDGHDSSREASPMRIPEDAVIIDTTNLTTEQTVNRMLDEFKTIFKS